MAAEERDARSGRLHVLSSLGVELRAVDLPPSFPAGDYNGALGAPTLADLDDDADLEVVVGTVASGAVAYDLPNTAGARILWGTGRGGPQRTGVTASTSPAPHTVRGDFDGDGRSDILWRHVNGSLHVWFMDGSAVVSGASLPPVSAAWSVVGTGDFDGDGRDDILWRHAGGALYEWLMSGATVVGQGFTAAQAGPGWVLRAIADLDGDDRSDLLWRHRSGGVYLWRMNGTSVIASGFLPGVTSSWSLDGVGDLDGDGREDLLWREQSSGTTYVWLMNGTDVIGEGFTAAQAAPIWRIEALGDLGGDGRADILWRHANGALHAWMMNGAGLSTSGPLGSVSLDWEVRGLVDFDGGGTADILWREKAGQTHLWSMSGLSAVAAGDTSARAGNAWRVRSPR